MIYRLLNKAGELWASGYRKTSGWGTPLYIGVTFILVMVFCVCPTIRRLPAKPKPTSQPIAENIETVEETNTPTPEPTEAPQPTDTPRPPTGTPNPTDTPEFAIYESGGLGMLRAQWEQSHTPTGESEHGIVYGDYETWFSDDDKIRRIYYQSELGNLSQDEAEIIGKSLIPADSQHIKNYISVSPDSPTDLYYSESLANQFDELDVWDGDSVGEFSISYDGFILDEIYLVVVTIPAIAENEPTPDELLDMFITDATEKINTITNATIELSEYLSNPQLNNEDWIIGVAIQAASIQVAHEELTEMDVPPEMTEIHEATLNGTKDCSIAMDYLLAGIDNISQDDTLKASEYMVRCGNKLLKTSGLIANYIQGTEQTNALPQKNDTTETPTVEPTEPAPKVVTTCPNMGVQITSPASGASFDQRHISIGGTANIANYHHHKIEYSTDPTNEAWNFLLEIDTPVDNGQLMELDTSTIPDGPYGVRLTVVDLTGNYPEPCVVWFNDGSDVSGVGDSNNSENTESEAPMIPSGRCECTGNYYNCDDFAGYDSQQCFEYCIEQGAGDVHDLDRDDDGFVCESSW